MRTNNEPSRDTRPDKARLLSKLRGFQQRTVQHVVARLLDERGSRRFLVADEVGLGKTLIARGVIAELVDRLWDKPGRINIVYVCSNSALARENLDKIRIGGSIIRGTRLTLLPTELEDFDPKLNFISFTPGTALKVKGYGRVDEREVLHALLRRRYGDPAWLRNLLQGEVEVDRWRDRVASPLRLDDGLASRFLALVDSDTTLQADLSWAQATLVRHDSRLSSEQASKRYGLVGSLRQRLARICIESLEPALIILDEFQRFKDLISSAPDEASELGELAQQLLGYIAPDQQRVATLMLSATPYRMFATQAETAAEDHYRDFRDTLRFLYDDPVQFGALEASLERYRRGLLSAAAGLSDDMRDARDDLQRRLKQVMVRTERVGATVERDSMVEEPAIETTLTRRDVEHYLAADELSRALGSPDVVELWKSSPYLLNFMKDYHLKRRFTEEIKKKSKHLRDHFDRLAREFLSVDEIQGYREIDPANGRLRALTSAVLDGQQWRMLWLAPSVPYWPLGAAWRDNAHFSKKLVFSSWNVVPGAVSALVSYEAERRMVGKPRGLSYRGLHAQRKPLLRYAMRQGKVANMTTLILAFPCLTLADEISPLAIALAGEPVREAVRDRVASLIERVRPWCKDPSPDVRWHWAAPLLLDRDDPGLRRVFDTWVREASSDAHDETEGAVQGPSRDHRPSGLRAHVDEALRVLDGTVELGQFPEGLVETLTDLALGGPAILMARALAPKGPSPSARRLAAIKVAGGLRTLFNEPPVVRMLARSTTDQSYWRTTLHYAFEGNLQAVLDEEVHLLWEQAAWDDRRTADEICDAVATEVYSAVAIGVSHVSPDLYASGKTRIVAATHTDESGATEAVSLRNRFALRYGTGAADTGSGEAREQAVRRAFKSPFFPFVLVSTSVGQEGLDFHPWCHDIWHWNLPGNPVDLEQREGRVHRYKGLAVRRNVAEDALTTLRERWQPGADPWEVLFSAAEDKFASTHDELVPYWVAPGPHKVRRCVPMLPLSSEIDKLRHLKRSLAIYRVVFGQPRQDELLELLQGSPVGESQLGEWAVSLRPDPA